MLGGSQTWWSSQQWMKACLTNLVMFCFREKSIGLKEHYQYILLMVYKKDRLEMIYDDYGHWCLESIIALTNEHFYLNTMCLDVTECVINCPWCQENAGSHTKPISLVAYNPKDLLCMKFTKTDLPKMVWRMCLCKMIYSWSSSKCLLPPIWKCLP